MVLEIFDKEGNATDEAVSLIDENFRYINGETVIPEEKILNIMEGLLVYILFCLVKTL